MQKSKRNSNKTMLFTVESVDHFFQRGKKTARDADHARVLVMRHVISFEDPVDFMKFLTRNKLRLVSTIRKRPHSVSRLASLLHRSRAAVNKDIQELESVGILKSEYIINPGHGRQRIVSLIDKNPIHLQMKAVI